MGAGVGGDRLLASRRAMVTMFRVYDADGRSQIATLHGLRQQIARRDGRPNVSIADFVAPTASARRRSCRRFRRYRRHR